MKPSKIGVFTSGGDAPGMNAALRAVVRTAIYYKQEAFGIYRGYEGMIEGDIVPLNERSVARIINRGGTVLKSARSEAFKTKEGRKAAFNELKKHSIDALIGIGGDGTFNGLHAFSMEYKIPVVGLPGTIDNDIFGTDNTIGYDTACNTAMRAIDNIRDTATSHNRLFFIEVMGRDAGFIALRCAISTGAKAVMLPETHTEPKELLALINRGSSNNKTSNIVIVSEGNKNGNAYDIAQQIKGLAPYFDTKVAVLGHIQRGGSPSSFDRLLASRLGVAAVEALVKNNVDIMLGVRNEKIVHTPLEQAIKENHSISNELLHIVNVLSI